MSTKRKLAWIAIVFSAAIVAALGRWVFLRLVPEALRFRGGVVAANAHPFTYDDYDEVLKKYVDDHGMVNYKALKIHSERLDAFAGALGTLDPKTYAAWNEREKIAFWVNAYNALTLEAIIHNYPIQSSFIVSLVFPKNSILQIPGVWKKLHFLVIGRQMSLDDIEHGTLRKQFNEPRIHMALVCAAMGCPPLRNEPYTGTELDVQLDDQARRFLSDPRKFRIDRDEGRVYLSPIFKWFGEDFIKTYGTNEEFAGHNQVQRAVLNFVSSYVNASDRDYLTTRNYSVKYLGYDWSLNEQREK